MTEEQNIELQCMRLVDGELSAVEEDDLLATCELNPELYREIALAFCEDRRLRAVFQQGPASEEYHFAAGALGDAQPHAASLPIHKPSRKRGHGATTGRFPLQGWTLGLAASLLVGAFVGYLAAPGERQGMGTLPGSMVSDTRPPVSNDDLGGGEYLASGNATLVQHDSNPAQIRTISEHPQLETLARRLEPSPFLPPESIAELANDGVQVDQSTQLFLIELSNGRHLAVPAQFINLSAR